ALEGVWPPQAAPRRRRLNLALAGSAVAALVVAVAAFASHGPAWFERGYPARAADVVAAAAAADPKATVFANERYADWLLFEQPLLHGRVAYDLRFELLTGRQLTRVARFPPEAGTGWSRIADGFRSFVLDPRGDAGAVKLLAGEPGARVLFRNRDVAVIERARR